GHDDSIWEVGLDLLPNDAGVALPARDARDDLVPSADELDAHRLVRRGQAQEELLGGDPVDVERWRNDKVHLYDRLDESLVLRRLRPGLRSGSRRRWRRRTLP